MPVDPRTLERLLEDEFGELEGAALVDELARRLDQAEDGSALITRLMDRVHAKVAGRLADGLAPVRRLDYDGHSIRLFVSSSAIARRLGSVAKEPFTVDWIEQSLEPGDVFYDIGANVGPYALIAAKATRGGAQVFAFEPSPASFRDLARNVELNDCTATVTPLPIALWSETGLLPVTWRSGDAGAARHRLGRRRKNGKAGSLTLGMRLDDVVERLGIPPPTHVKIDVDGHELEVLLGAQKTLADPEWQSILIELDRDETDRNGAIRELLRATGFEVGVLQERSATRRYPDPARRPDLYWLFTRRP